MYRKDSYSLKCVLKRPLFGKFHQQNECTGLLTNWKRMKIFLINLHLKTDSNNLQMYKTLISMYDIYILFCNMLSLIFNHVYVIWSYLKYFFFNFETILFYNNEKNIQISINALQNLSYFPSWSFG